MRLTASRGVRSAVLVALGALVVAACQPAAKAEDPAAKAESSVAKADNLAPKVDDRDISEAYRDNRAVWGLDPRATSGTLARGGWKFVSMSTLSWPDGRQAVVTMWMSNLGDHARCFDYFDAAMKPAGGKCERSGTGI